MSLTKVCVYVHLQEPVFENENLGTTVVRVSAKDADSGLFAVIEYSLVDGEGKFGIIPSTVSHHNRTAALNCGKRSLSAPVPFSSSLVPGVITEVNPTQK